MSGEKEYLNAEEFEDALKALDTEMSHDEWLVAFGPIRLIAAGGFLAVTFLQNRDSTADVDYLIDPEFEREKEIRQGLDNAIVAVALQQSYNRKWMNNDMAIFVSRPSRQTLFKKALEQNITLFQGENLEILAAPIEWALERKLRRIYNGGRGRKAEMDMADALAFLKYLRTRDNGPLVLESVRTMNWNGFDVLPDSRTMQLVAFEYRKKYSEQIFRS
ncbi:hypothetical protein N7451_002196 [Penicillium sp. IBT 35674x]|nr:hypothetical protein N7451_002196 [Penicillium sp. IBT 35674x]